MRTSRGFTLVEVVTAALLLAGTLVGFLLIMGDNLKVSRETELRFASQLLAEGEVERIKAALHADYSTDVSAWSTDLGNGYQATRTVSTVSTYLKEITVETGYDTSGNSSLDSEEVLVTLRTQYADN